MVCKNEKIQKIIIVTNKNDDLPNEYLFSTGYLGIKATDKLPLSFLTGVIFSPNFLFNEISTLSVQLWRVLIMKALIKL